MMGGNSGSRASHEAAGASSPSGFDPGRLDVEKLLLEMDCTGDETLWVARYAFHLSRISGNDLADCIPDANTAWQAWGNDPETTPEEIASSDYAEWERAQ